MDNPYPAATIINKDPVLACRYHFPGAQVIITFKPQDVIQPIVCLNPSENGSRVRTCNNFNYFPLHITLISL